MVQEVVTEDEAPSQGDERDEEDDGELERGFDMSPTELADVLVNKKNCDKFSVDIVNDLEAILCSPIRPRVSESSVTGLDYSYPPMLMEEEEVVVDNGAVRGGRKGKHAEEQHHQDEKQQNNNDEDEDVVVDEPVQKKARQTIIECRRTYLPSQQDKKKPKPGLGKQYTAKIAATSSSSRTSSSGSNNNAATGGIGPYGIVKVSQLKRSPPVGGGKGVRVEMTPIANHRLSTTTTEDDEEAPDHLEELLNSTNGGASGGKLRRLHRCQICSIAMEDQREFRKHVETHF